MPVGDNAFAAELITPTGQIYKFDAIECMVGLSRMLGYTGESNDPQLHYFVRDFHTLEWLEGRKAVYIKADIYSPMGLGIAAFADSAQALEILKEYRGIVMDFQGLMRIEWSEILETPWWKQRQRQGEVK